MNVGIILALSTIIGIPLGGVLARQTEAGVSPNLSRYYVARATITAEEDSSQSPRTQRKLVKSSTPIKTSQSRPRSVFDLLNENEALPKAKSKKGRNSKAATAPIQNQLSRGSARRAELRKYLAAEAARQAEEKRKKPEEVFELFNGDELKSKSGPADSVAVTAVDADELKKRLAEKAARRAQTKKWLTAEIKVGERDARVPMIRARMVKLGFLSEDNSLAWMLGHPADKVSNPLDLELILDKELSKAIKAFQKGNGIKQTGRIDSATVAALNAPEAAEEERKAQEAELALTRQRQAEEAERQRLAAEAAEKQRQAEEAERQRLAAEVAEKQRQAEEERKAQEAALALAKQRQAEEAERQRMAAEAAAKQRQAEEKRKAQEAALALAKQRQAEEAERQRLAAEVAEKQRQAAEAERLAAEVAEKQRQAEEKRKAQEAALALAKQRQAEGARRLAHNRKVASLDSALGANEALSKSCNKAKSIIGKWGFEDIKANSCTGKVYHFSGTRKGKRFSVKINALTSELTEVKRVLSSAAE